MGLNLLGCFSPAFLVLAARKACSYPCNRSASILPPSCRKVVAIVDANLSVRALVNIESNCEKSGWFLTYLMTACCALVYSLSPMISYSELQLLPYHPHQPVFSLRATRS